MRKAGGALHKQFAIELRDISMRTFTFHEAQSLLPVLESLLRQSMEAKQTIEAVEQEFSDLGERIFINGGTFVDVLAYAKRRAQRDKAVESAKNALGEINAVGVQVKDLDIGLLDFPCDVDGEIILLCWKLGEEALTQWHGMEEGFAGRKPIDDRIINAKGSSQ
jgi:hypothetical protein